MLFSPKTGYILLNLYREDGSLASYTAPAAAPDICGSIFEEMAEDVLRESGNGHSFEEADSMELAATKAALSPYLRQLPEYAGIAEKIITVMCEADDLNGKEGL